MVGSLRYKEKLNLSEKLRFFYYGVCGLHIVFLKEREELCRDDGESDRQDEVAQ
jgi:hypothetical protein